MITVRQYNTTENIFSFLHEPKNLGMLQEIYDGCIPIHVRLLLLLTMYPEGQEQVPPSGEA